jgi:hypothetical protein
MWVNTISLTPSLIIEVSVPCPVSDNDFASFYYFPILFWNCPDSVVFFILHFINKKYIFFVVVEIMTLKWYLFSIAVSLRNIH